MNSRVITENHYNLKKKAMLALKQGREKLNDSEKKYTDEQVLAIRDFFYKLAKINVDYINEKLTENKQKGNIVRKNTK